MGMFKKLLKILLWLIGSGILLIVLTLAGFYLYYAIPMQERFAKLKTVPVTTTWEAYPVQLRQMFERINSRDTDLMLARQLIEGLHHSQSEFTPRYAVGTLEIKRHYSQRQRQELYFNQCYIGSSGNNAIRGMNDAAHYYFGKPPAQLSIAEMALLVGIAKGAIYYNPFKYPDRALKRRNQVLEIAHNDNLITTAEYQAALKEPLPTEPHL